MSNRSPARKQFWLAMAACSASAVLSLNSARAVVETWTGLVDTNWSSATAPTNWSTTVPLNADSLVFNDSGVGLTNTDDIAGLSVAGIAFAGTVNSYNLSGSTALTLAGNITDTSTVAQTISLPINFSASRSIQGGASAATGLLMSGTMTNNAVSGIQTLTLTGFGSITGSQVGSGALAANSGTIYNSTGNWSFLGNGTSTVTRSSLIVGGNGTINFGSATDSPTLTLVSSRTANTGTGTDNTLNGNVANSTANFNMVSGTLTLGNRLNTGSGNGANETANLTQTGGTLKILDQCQLSNGSLTNVANFNISGGIFDLQNTAGTADGANQFYVASRGTGTLTVSGSALVEVSTLDVSRDITNGTKGTVNLDGGILQATTVSSATANSVAANTLSSGTFNFNGGTLRAGGSSATFLTENSPGNANNTPITYNVKIGGAVLDSNTFNITAVKPLIHDAGLGATADGGLTKKNAGTLTLLGANTYTGATTIMGGTLAITSATANSIILNSSKIIVGDSLADNAAIFDVSGITASGGYQVAAGQTLAGYGTVNGGSMNFASSAILAPGNSAGTLTHSGNTSFSTNVILNYDLDTPDVAAGTGGNDLYVVGGSLLITQGLTLNVTPGANFGAGVYHLATSALLLDSSFGFTGYTVNGIDPSLTATFSVTNTPNGLDLIVTSGAPEPASIALLGVGTLALLARRRK